MNKEKVLKFREDAIKDGWAHEPIYGDQEPEEQAMSLKFQGFSMLIYARPGEPGTARKVDGYPNGYHYSVSIWGPDGLSIETPEAYSMSELESLMHKCRYCGSIGETVRINFAGRCCPSCREKYAPEAEPPGWAD